MKFLIFIAGRIRNGHFPRVPNFQYNEAHGKFCYLGRELTSDEFNAAVPDIFNPNFRNNGYTFAPLAIAEPEYTGPVAGEQEGAIEEIDEPPVELAVNAVISDEDDTIDTTGVNERQVLPHSADLSDPIPAIVSTAADSEDEQGAEDAPSVEFTIRERKIFAGEQHIAGLFGESDQLRVLSEFKDLKPEIEAWLATQTA